jgi:hypothetical protein
MAASGYWQKRNARAKELGYRNYYDYRAHDNGRLPPNLPALRGSELARSRGHRSAADLERLLRSGRVELVSTAHSFDAKGRPVTIALVTLAPNGETREYQLRGDQPKKVARIIDDMGTDAPQLIGSPKTLARFGVDVDEEAGEAARGELDADEQQYFDADEAA